MIRKITNIIGTILLIGVISIYIIGKIENRPDPETLFYSINTLYSEVFYPNEEYEFNFYCFKKIPYEDLKYKLLSNNTILNIDIRNVSSNVAFSYNGYKYNLVKVNFLANQTIASDNIFLEIEHNTNKYKLKLGSMYIEKGNTILNYNHLEGHYSYINSALTLIGITINVSNTIKVNDISLGGNKKIQLQNIRQVTVKDSIVDYNELGYRYAEKPKGEYVIKANQDYFLPIYYDNLCYINKCNLKINSIYEIESFNFHITTKNLSTFQSLLYKGKII